MGMKGFEGVKDKVVYSLGEAKADMKGRMFG